MYGEYADGDGVPKPEDGGDGTSVGERAIGTGETGAVARCGFATVAFDGGVCDSSTLCGDPVDSSVRVSTSSWSQNTSCSAAEEARTLSGLPLPPMLRKGMTSLYTTQSSRT